MSSPPFTVRPEDVRARSRDSRAQHGWVEQVVEYVREATAAGEIVTLTSKPQFMTPEQVAEALGVSRPTISRRIKTGELRAVKVGNRNRIPYEEFARYRLQMMGDMIDATREELRDDLFGT